MISWFGIIIVAPLWGLTSTQLFLQSWLAFINFCINFLGFVRGRVPRSNTAIAAGFSIVQIILFSSLLSLGNWLLIDILNFGWTLGENVSYWIFAVIGLGYMLPQIPTRLRSSWQVAMIPGALELHILSSNRVSDRK